MRLFISYSRKDRAFVDKLRTSLESTGHDVWVDTDDIRGSDQWRASIVAGIQGAEAFLLVVSPHSVVSEHVEREVTIASEEDRRIVPVVLHDAAFSGSIRFELAGIQQVSFVGRSFGEGIVELDRELDALAGHGADVAPAPSSASRPSGRLVTVLAIATGVVVILVFATSLAGDSGAPQSSTSTSAPSASDQSGSSGGPSKAEFERDFGVSAWFAGFDMTLVSGLHDRGSGQVEFAVDIVNTMSETADPGATVTSYTAAVLEWGEGRRSGAFCDGCQRLPSGARVRATLEFDVGEDFRWDGAVLAIGETRQHHVRIPLDGTDAVAEAPIEYDIDGIVDAGSGVSFEVERVEVVPAGCWGLADGLTFVPSSEDWFAVVVWGTAVSNDSPHDVGFGRAELVTPDGDRVGSTSLEGPVYALGLRQAQPDVGVCFDVRGPIGGEYRFSISAVGADFGPDGIDLAL